MALPFSPKGKSIIKEKKTQDFLTSFNLPKGNNCVIVLDLFKHVITLGSNKPYKNMDLTSKIIRSSDIKVYESRSDGKTVP